MWRPTQVAGWKPTQVLETTTSTSQVGRCSKLSQHEVCRKISCCNASFKAVVFATSGLKFLAFQRHESPSTPLPVTSISRSKAILKKGLNWTRSGFFANSKFRFAIHVLVFHKKNRWKSLQVISKNVCSGLRMDLWAENSGSFPKKKSLSFEPPKSFWGPPPENTS